MPGVSRKMNCPSSAFKIPVIRFLVVWGLLLVMAIFSPRIAFRSVDLPTLGRPAMAMNPDLNKTDLRNRCSVFPPAVPEHEGAPRQRRIRFRSNGAAAEAGLQKGQIRAAHPDEVRQVRRGDVKLLSAVDAAGLRNQLDGHVPEEIRFHEAAKSRVPGAGKDAPRSFHLTRRLQPQADDGDACPRESHECDLAPRDGLLEGQGAKVSCLAEAGEFRVPEDEDRVD